MLMRGLRDMFEFPLISSPFQQTRVGRDVKPWQETHTEREG